MMKIKAENLESVVEMVSPIREPRGLHIVLDDEREFADIAKDFSGHARLEVLSDEQDGITIYDGYVRITSMYRRGSSVTLVLEKEK